MLWHVIGIDFGWLRMNTYNEWSLALVCQYQYTYTFQRLLDVILFPDSDQNIRSQVCCHHTMTFWFVAAILWHVDLDLLQMLLPLWHFICLINSRPKTLSEPDQSFFQKKIVCRLKWSVFIDVWYQASVLALVSVHSIRAILYEWANAKLMSYFASQATREHCHHGMCTCIRKRLWWLFFLQKFQIRELPDIIRSMITKFLEDCQDEEQSAHFDKKKCILVRWNSILDLDFKNKAPLTSLSTLLREGLFALVLHSPAQPQASKGSTGEWCV